ncbi:MAG: hypothetical protein M1836_007595 [Candelina mexicana]|nr:MAG: hypothetical protein M1836_007595 [Candelina mexicana]
MHFFTALILFIIPTVTLASDNCKCQDPDGVQYDELTRQCCINVKLGLHYGNITPVHVYTDGDGEIDMKELSQDKKDWVYRYEQENAGPELAYEDTYHEVSFPSAAWRKRQGATS